MEKELLRIISPLREKTDSYIIFLHHLHRLTESTIQHCERMVSFDVKFVYANK